MVHVLQKLAVATPVVSTITSQTTNPDYAYSACDCRQFAVRDVESVKGTSAPCDLQFEALVNQRLKVLGEAVVLELP